MQFPVMGMAGIALGVADVKVFARELSEKAVSQSRDLMEKRHAEMKDGRGRRRGPRISIHHFEEVEWIPFLPWFLAVKSE